MLLLTSFLTTGGTSSITSVVVTRLTFLLSSLFKSSLELFSEAFCRCSFDSTASTLFRLFLTERSADIRAFVAEL